MNGGYVMIDWDGVILSERNVQNVPGIYDATKDAIDTGKMVVVANCKNGAFVYSPIPIFANKKTTIGSLSCVLLGYTITIDDDNSVSVIGG
jgi:hypothetical protein